jgi:hypothetical protein
VGTGVDILIGEVEMVGEGQLLPEIAVEMLSLGGNLD